MRFKNALSVASIAAQALLVSAVWAGVSPEEAKQLGATLTEFGAESAANADGSIPAYTGGLTKAPAGFKAETGHYIDPYADEKPLYTITAENLKQYEELLNAGPKELFKRFPDYTMNVYPTHRSMHYPKWVIDNTVKNATAAKLSGKVDGDRVEGAYSGIPFPIPKNGYEVMWNAALAYWGPYNEGYYGGGLMDSAGRMTALPEVQAKLWRPYYDPKLTKPYDGTFYYYQLFRITTPPTLAGYTSLQYYPLDYSDQNQVNWVYEPGQRRTRVAPNYAYDTPVAQYGGTFFYDESYGFLSRMDRFEFKLVGKKELIIPYNDYKFVFDSTRDQNFGPKHLNADRIRYEKHRVWEIEATLKATSRHAYARRVFYADEDSWALVAVDNYDHGGNLFRIAYNYPFFNYDGRGGVNVQDFGFYDLQKGNYAVIGPALTREGQVVQRFLDANPNQAEFSGSGIGERVTR